MVVLNNIYAIRTQQQLSLRELSKLSGVSYVTINKIENGLCSPSQLTMLLLSRALGVPTQLVFHLDYTKIDLD